MSSAEHERLLRRARAQDAALFRYRLIGPALEEGLTTKQRGRVVRRIAGQVHAGPGGRGVQVSRKTIDRWCDTEVAHVRVNSQIGGPA